MRRRLFAFVLQLVSVNLFGGNPVIGISSGYTKRGFVTVEDKYVQAVLKAGGVPLVMPLVTSDRMAQWVIKAVDGIVLTGGEDVNPSLYGQEVLNSTVSFNSRRDSSDVRLIRAALKSGKPILAICRGLQISNVVLGGSLYQDIPSQIETSLNHKQAEQTSVPTHRIILEPDSYISGILGGAKEICVNSLHHQCIKDQAPGLRITGRAEDGIIEAVEGLPELNLVGVQFHPEALVDGPDPLFLRFFEDLTARAKAARK